MTAETLLEIGCRASDHRWPVLSGLTPGMAVAEMWRAA
jgi:hypothetical protein